MQGSSKEMRQGFEKFCVTSKSKPSRNLVGLWLDFMHYKIKPQDRRKIVDKIWHDLFKG